MQFTWSDYGDEKYFHIFDTETRSMTPIHNPLTMFEKCFYDDTKESFETITVIKIIQNMKANSQK